MMKYIKSLFWLFCVFTTFDTHSAAALRDSAREEVAAGKKELGIVLLANSEVAEATAHYAQQIRKKLTEMGVEPSENPNISHISLFQGCFPDTNVADLLNAIKKIAASGRYAPFAFRLDPELTASDDVSWMSKEAKEDPKLNALLQEVVDAAKVLRDTSLMRQVRDMDPATIDGEKADLIAKYGVPFGVPEKFNPHVTVVYAAGKTEDAQEAIKGIHVDPLIFEARVLALVELGYPGNAIRVLETWPLSKA